MNSPSTAADHSVHCGGLDGVLLPSVSGGQQKVDVEVEGKWYALSSLSANNIRLTVPFTNITKAGEQELRVSASLTGVTASDIKIARVVPETVKLTFDTVAELPFTIEPKMVGVTASEGLIAELPVLSEDTVNIKGAKTMLDQISKVVAQVEVNKTLSRSESYTTALKVYDKDDKPMDLSKFILDLKEVTVTQPISKQKDLKLNATFKNTPEFYQKYPLATSISPSTIKVIGDAEIVDSISSIELDAIDFSSITPTQNKFTYAVSLPKGVRSVDNVKSVNVTIDTSGIETKTVDITTFLSKNVPEGKAVTADVQSKSVTIAGPKDVISSIDATALNLQYDLSQLEAPTGSHVVTALVKSDKYKNVWGVGEIKIQVSIQ